MILLVIIAVSLVQAMLNLAFTRFNVRIGRIIVLLVVLCGHVFFLPKFFYPKPDPDGVNCGMPIVGITLAFWVLGVIAATLTHILVGVYLAKKNRHPQRPV
ncbi:MAG TPA: hypothetical protein VGD40_22120 [Chryseosolibacter sp.]